QADKARSVEEASSAHWRLPTACPDPGQVCALRSDRPKRRTVALRASVGSTDGSAGTCGDATTAASSLTAKHRRTGPARGEASRADPATPRRMRANIDAREKQTATGPTAPISSSAPMLHSSRYQGERQEFGDPDPRVARVAQRSGASVPSRP